MPPALKADKRYRVVSEIGRGGMGVVYDAIDKETGERVAIKVLSSKKDGLLRFKNEFRLASRLAHPNLVALYDLVITDEVAYFVMEYAPGVDLRRYVRGPARTTADLPRLYATLTQILEALECLGAAGIVHKDLKPSNIIVAEDGQVKLLDFGLAGAHDTPDFAAAMLAGTPTYMSPEQIDGRPMGPATDLYALGIVVYELLVGEPPFLGAQRQVLNAQRQQYPVPPSDRVEGVPEDFELWTLKLLAKKPEDRFPSARAARAALEKCGAPAGKQVWNEVGSGQYGALSDLELVGRDSERALLGALLDRVRDGACHMALVMGDSGIGKTALAEAVLAEAHETGCVVLRGACREHESISYNAFDAVIDEAATQVERLVAQSKLTREQLAEEAEDLALLGRLFPVLRELHAGLPALDTSTHGGVGDRERAFGVVKRLVERVTKNKPLVLLLDDLHWADEDSLALLAHLLAPPSAKGLLVLATAWPQEKNTPLERFLQHQRQSPDSLLTQLTLGPLGEFEAGRVVETAVTTPVPRRTVDLILREAQGNPFLLMELARLAIDEGIDRPTVGEVARRRISLLDDDEKVLVELAAVAPSPVDAEVLHAALEAFSRPLSLESAGLRRLVGLKILRESGARARSLDAVQYDFYHHRLRETIKAEIPEDRKKTIHLHIADALKYLRPHDPESLVRELMLGGNEKAAGEHAEAAAEGAMSRLAHARAVDLFSLALKHAAPSDQKRLRVRLGEALEGTGRFREAAGHYILGLEGDAIKGLPRIHFQLRLSNCLMHVGQLEQSGELVERSLHELGHPTRRGKPMRMLVVLGLLLRSIFSGLWKRSLRKVDDNETLIRLTAYSLAVPHFQFTSRNVAQLEFALRYRLLGGRSPSAEIRQEALAISLMLLIPFQHVGPWIEKRVDSLFSLLETNHPRMASERGRAWLPLLRALYAMIRGRPDQAMAHFDELADYGWARTGYVALQRHNAQFLAGAYDKYVSDLAATAHHDGALKPLDIARLAYIERVRGHHETARRLMEDIARTAPEDVPWTHRSLYTYQIVELKLLDGDTEEAARLARNLVQRIRRGAVSPTTGAFESLDAVTRAFLAEARRLRVAGQIQAAEALISDAEKAIKQVPVLAPPLFAGRLCHDRGIVALAQGRRAEALKHLQEAEEVSRETVVPCFRMRLLEDLLEVLDRTDPRRAKVQQELDDMSESGTKLERRRKQAPWLWKEIS
jgi:tetratricopeptide (TPR) repeat protein/predicted Ser/Thr protein kinase